MNKDRWQGALSRPPRLSGGGIYLMQSGAHECYITIEFDAGIYSKQAVQSAIYDLDIAALISITGHNKKIIQIKIQSPEDNNTTLKAKIYKAVLDHQIRIDVKRSSALLGN